MRRFAADGTSAPTRPVLRPAITIINLDGLPSYARTKEEAVHRPATVRPGIACHEDFVRAIRHVVAQPAEAYIPDPPGASGQNGPASHHDPQMTRFWLPWSTASLQWWLHREMHGGEIFCPKIRR